MSRLVGSAVALLGCSVLVALTGCGGGESTASAPETATASTVAKEQGHRWDCPNRSGYKMYPAIQPGRIVQDPDPIGAGDGMSEIVNEWRAGAHRLVTTVDAGRDFRDRSNGLLAITRDRPCTPGYNRKHGDDVRVAGAGPLKITKAPLGRKAAYHGQTDGTIQFTSKSGVRGTLHLKNDIVRLNQAAHHRDRPMPCHKGSYGDLGYRYPGRILGIPDGYFSDRAMTLGAKMWWVNDCRHFTVVGGGADPDHLQMGLLGILRERDHAPNNESVKYIKVPGAGTVVITKAPLGPGVETWAQKRGNIEFKSKNGITGTLHLKDDTVTLDL
jgi:hypothetical protein